MSEPVHLRVHSHYSFGRGASSVEELLDRAVEVGIKHLALTDRNGLYGSTRFYRGALERGLKPVIGAEIDDPGCQRRRVVVLAADRRGFTDLCRLITRRHLDDDFELLGSLLELGGGCRVLTGDEWLLRGLVEGGARKTTCGEINPVSIEDRAGVGRLILLARRLGVPVVATGDVYFAEPSDHHRHLILRAIAQRGTLHGLKEGGAASPGQHLTGKKEMSMMFREMPEALEAAAGLTEECCLDLEMGKWKFPAPDIPPGETPFSCLWRQAVEGLATRYRPVSIEAARRLVKELLIIERGGFTPYFLLVKDIIRQTADWGLRHVGRGSAANSLVSYCLGMTDVDPLALNLYFERFLNRARKSPPDIDLDFSWKERDRVLDYVRRRYGEERVAMISTHVTFGPRAAVREVARVLGLGPEEIGRITRRIPYWGCRSLGDLKEVVPECRDLPLDEEPWKRIISLAEGLLGRPRHLSVHPGGIIVAPEELTRWMPMERAASGQVVTQYDMFGVEDVGLVKIDLLSQRSLGVLEDILCDLADEVTSPPVDDLERVTGDGATRDLIRQGRTMGCFYIESPAMRSLLKKLRTETFEELTAASSVIRPGVAESGMMAAYIERHRSPEKAHYVDERLKKILGETYGVMVYQEDVIRVAHEVAGLSLEEADLLRRSMSGKMRSPEAMDRLERGFLEGAAEKGVDMAAARELWRQIKSFAGYAFCKAHSASYAVLSFRLAYLKAHHPAHFMAAVLSNGGGYYAAGAYIQECRRLSLPLRPPDINISRGRYTAEDGGVRVGLMAIKGLSAGGLESILRARRSGGAFRDLGDLAERTHLSVREREILVRCGACDSFGPNRPALMWRLASLPPPRRESGDVPLPGARFEISLPPLRDYTRREKCEDETGILGYALTCHPLDLLGEAIPPGVVPSDEMVGHIGRRVRMVGWPIAYKRVRTKKGKVMKFLSLEDGAGTFEAVLFPEVYRRSAPETVNGGGFLLKGEIRDDYGVCILVVERVERIRLKSPGRRAALS